MSALDSPIKCGARRFPFPLILPRALRVSKKDFARFIEIASGSLFEVVSQSVIAKNQGFLPETSYQQLYTAAEEQSRMLSGLKKSLFPA